MASNCESIAKVVGAVRYQGRKLQSEFPHIRFLYRAGQSLPQIAELVNKNPYLNKTFGNVSNSTMATITRYALHGNDRPGCGPVYEGLLSDAEYNTIARQHEKDAGTNGHSRNMKNGRGVLFASSQTLADAARQSAKKRGRVTWDDQKLIDRVYDLKAQGMSYREIAVQLNKESNQRHLTEVAVNTFFKRDAKEFKKTLCMIIVSPHD